MLAYGYQCEMHYVYTFITKVFCGVEVRLHYCVVLQNDVKTD